MSCSPPIKRHIKQMTRKERERLEDEMMELSRINLTSLNHLPSIKPATAANGRDEYRVVTYFFPYKSWDHASYREKLITSYKEVSRIFYILSHAEDAAKSMQRLHDSEYMNKRGYKVIALIQSQEIQHRIVTEWETIKND